jgi:polyribonucleotide nucleotidyltransferase
MIRKKGEIYQGTVVKTVDFGAFVNFFGPEGRPCAYVAAGA